MANVEELMAEHRKEVSLNDFLITCLLEDSKDPILGVITVVVHGFGEEDTAHTEKITPTSWKYHREIQLYSGMNEIIISIQSEDAGNIGYIIFPKDELAEFMAIDHDVELKRDFIALEEKSPLLRLSFTLVVSENTTPGIGSSNITPNIGHLLDTIQSPERFSNMLAGLAERPGLVNDLGHLFNERFLETNSEDDINKAILAYELAVKLTASDDTNYGTYASAAGIALVNRFELSGRLPDINMAIHMMELATAYTAKGDANYPSQLNNLGVSFQWRFERTGELADITSAITHQQKAVQLTPEGHVDLPSRLNNLGTSMQMRFEHSGELVDIENAISNQQRSIQLTPEGHAEMPSRLNNLGVSLQRRFERTGDLTDIANAISNKQRAIQLTPERHVDMAARLNNLGVSLQTRFECSGDLADITNAISNKQRAIQLTPDGHAKMPSWLNNLGNSFQTRFERTGDLADISSAILNHQKAIQLTPEGHADMATRLNNLGVALHTSFEHTDILSDISNAIYNKQKAVQLTPEGHADMPFRLNNLGNSFRARFQRTGDLKDISSAILNQQKAIHLIPEGHANMATVLNDLGNSFQARFEYTGDLADISDAISNKQRAVKFTPDGHAKMVLWLNNLGNSFRTRFEHTGNLADIASAISCQERAVLLAPEGHANMGALLISLGTSLQERFNHARDPMDIDSAISIKKKAIQLTPEEHAKMPSYLNSLGNSFQIRFKHTGDLADIVNSISNQQRAVQLTPEGHVHMASWLNNLGVSLRTQFERTGNPIDIANAISNQQRAVQLTPEGHADMPDLFNNLGSSFYIRFTSTHNMEDIREGISMFRRGAIQITGRPSARLDAARKWAQISRIYDTSQSLDAFHVAIQLLPLVAGLEQTIYKRHQTLVNISDITSSATAAAINDGKLETALAWLEQGRCLVWNQLNYLRTPAEDLRTYNSSLAGRFLHVAHALEISGSRQEQHTVFSEKTMTQMISLQEESNTHVHLAKQWNELLLEIRQIPEFQDFLQPPQASRLVNNLPQDGPIIIFNIHQDRCDALALIYNHDSPLHIPLETFNVDKAMQLRDNLRQYLNDNRVRQWQNADRGTFRLRPEGITIMYEVLRELWEHVVKPILDALDYSPNSSNPPRIWWCPTGPLAFLPIHAAGIYGKERVSAGSCVSDYVVSSYTPTVSALLDKINSTISTECEPTSLLIISQPSTPGQSSIPGAKQETRALRDMIEPPSKLTLLEDASATIIRVKEEMKSHTCVHFACHAIQEKSEPLKSGVQLHDGRLEVLEMMKQILPNADLAFLSACQTSTGDEKLSDEVVHLAAGMLAAGYRSVVATMWSIKDQYGPIIAKDFYTHILLENSGLADRRLDGTNAARALHYAMKNIRNELGDTEDALLTWVPYVHFGV